ncbi:MAG: hypothetical protein JEZ05_03185 [Tenericutes bacterium]|nr:hypothetical protein [Mycoplasmatota bacterium]
MNVKKLLTLENEFLSVHPEGFASPDMLKIAKKHNVNKLSQFVKEICSKGLVVIPDIVKIITKSSMVSVFEKMRFRDLIKELSEEEKLLLVRAIYENIHGEEEEGFNELVHLLKPYKLAKWTIISAFRAYYYLDVDVFMKPITIKKIIAFLELSGLNYNATPNYYFYFVYRNYINEMKELVNKSLSPNNPAFSGFLMMSIDYMNYAAL